MPRIELKYLEYSPDESGADGCFDHGFAAKDVNVGIFDDVLLSATLLVRHSLETGSNVTGRFHSVVPGDQIRDSLRLIHPAVNYQPAHALWQKTQTEIIDEIYGNHEFSPSHWKSLIILSFIILPYIYIYVCVCVCVLVLITFFTLSGYCL